MDIFGYKFFEKKKKEVGTLPEGCQIKVVDRRANNPEFKREYSTALLDRGTIEITMYTSPYSTDRRSSGTLRQHNGAYVFFDPERVADKIIDPVLVPLVEIASNTILAMDKEYMDSKPNTFTDENGNKWCRCEDKK
jgi:hypothetical protein